MNYIGNDGSREDAHFIRQRRNLLLISLFIIFYKAGNLELTTVSFLGNQTTIGNPAIIIFALGVFFTYFLWRYYTACREVSGVRSFWFQCTSWAEDKTKQYVERKEFPRQRVDSNKVQLIWRRIATRTYRICGDQDSPVSEDREVTIKYYYSFMKTMSIIPTILRTSSFSEYVLPFFIAAIAISEFVGFGLVENTMLIASEVVGQSIDAVGTLPIVETAQKTIADPMATLPKSDACVYELWRLCFIEPSSLSSSISVFGFAEFVTALALLVIVYTISDVRYRFRLHIAPIPLFMLTYICIAIIGFGTLLIDVWSASEWLVLDSLVNKYILQGVLGFSFLSLAMTWLFYAFIRPPVFNKRNAKRYAQRFLNIVIEGSENELSIIAHELGRSAKNIVGISRRAPSRTQTKEENQEAQSSALPTAEDYAYEILLMMGTRRLCRYIVSSAPITAMEFFAQFSDNLHKSLPVGQFVINISTEAILNKDSLLYHEDEGYSSGWLGYVRPFSEAIYGDYRLINMLSNDNDASPLDLHFKTAWELDAEQFEVYTRVTLITLEAYIKSHKRGCTQSFALNRAFKVIAHAANDIYKLDGVTDYYPSDELSKLDLVVSFIRDALRILNEHSTPNGRLKSHSDHLHKDIYDQMANMMFEIIFAASAVKSPRDTCWSVHYGSVWSNLMTCVEEGKAQKIIYHRLRRLLYNEICRLSDMPNYKSAGILAICLNVMGPVIHENTLKELEFALHKAMVSWLKKNYLTLREKQPDVAEACLIGSITYEEDTKRLVKSYIKGLRLEEPKEYLELNGDKND